jgi:hypothetical protein
MRRRALQHGLRLWPAGRPRQQQGQQGLATSAQTSDTVPLRTGRPRLVLLGTGWAAARLIRDVDPKLFDLTVGAKALPFLYQLLRCRAARGRSSKPACSATGAPAAASEPAPSARPPGDVQVISPRNHMVFTPLLASITVGGRVRAASALPGCCGPGGRLAPAIRAGDGGCACSSWC